MDNNWSKPTIEELAKAMYKAFHATHSVGRAVERVRESYPYADTNILWAMWYAIEAQLEMEEDSD